MSDLREIEQSLAYEHAGSLIESSCLTTELDEGGALASYYDLTSAEIDLTDEVAYLDSRRLLLHHATRPHLVMVLDESEPLPEVSGE